MGFLKKIFYTFTALFSLYLLAGFFILPNIAKDLIVKKLDENLNAKSNLEKIEFNPLTFDLKLHNFGLKSKENIDILNLKELQITLGILKSFEQKHFRVEYILLDELFLNINQDRDGNINLAQLLKEQETKEKDVVLKQGKQEELEEQENLAFLISKIDLKNTNFNFTSHINKEPYNLNLKDLNYTIYDLGTYKNYLSSNNLKFLINNKTEVAIKGAFNIKPFKAYGKIDIKDLRVKDFLSFDDKLFNFSVNEDANINLALNYNIDATNDLLLNLNSELLEINRLNLLQNGNNIAYFKKLNIEKFDFDLKEQIINFYNTKIDNLSANMIMDKAGVNFANLINTTENKEKESEDLKSQKAWKINFNNIQSNINYNFNNILLNHKIDIKDLYLNVNNLNIVDSTVNLKDAKIDLKYASYLDNKNKIDIHSQNNNIKLQNLSVINGDVKIGDIELKKENISFKEKNLDLEIISKKLETNLKNLEIAKNITYLKNSLNLNDLILIDKKNNLKIVSKALNLNTNNFLLDDKNNINFKEIILNNQNLSLFEKRNNLKIEAKDIAINSLDFLFDNKNNLKIKNINLKNKILHLEDENNNLSINTKDINLLSKDLLIDKDSNIKITNIKLEKPIINIFDAKNGLKIDANRVDLNLNGFKFIKNDIFLEQIKLLNPDLKILNTNTNLDINVKNIDLSLRKLISKDNFFKIEKTDLINPFISISLAKNNNQIDEKASEEANKKVSEKVDENSEKEAINSENKNSFKLNLGPVDIKNLSLDFEDKNLAIPFKTSISKLNGQISEVKNKDDSTSQLEIKGVVDEYGVAKITGVVNPNSLKILTDINMKFQNIAMKNFTPYTAKFVGREIKDGKLELDLNYNISESNLKAKNSIIIKKLELGKNIESEEAMSLPLDLAIALLEDSSNTIDINLPVSGNVDDPQFSVASIVWKAFVNLITKAITSPFSLIGSLFNFSEDEIKSVSFDLKESEITPIQQETLDKIALILDKKDDFAIKITPAFKEKDEKEKLANERALNIKEYLIKDKNIAEKQLIIESRLIKSSSIIELNIEQIK